MTNPGVELTKAEWAVIKAVWEREPCTAPEIQKTLLGPTGWTYSTVRTLMDRMAAKGALKARKEGKLTIFTSAVTRAQAQRGELLYALRNAFNGALAPMVQGLLDTGEVSPVELGELKNIIAAYEQASSAKRPEKSGTKAKR